MVFTAILMKTKKALLQPGMLLHSLHFQQLLAESSAGTHNTCLSP